MPITNEILAWRKHPEPNGTLYSREELQKKEAVIGLFIACQESAGYINADGWHFLFCHYGFKGLYEIDAISQWLTTEEEGEWISRLVYQSLNAGYNPIDQEKGDYDPDSGKFISMAGFVKMIDWDSIHQLRLH
ncbi:MAG: hypothetical protein KY428_06535 [Bacteroidetes bacterium]|nr:hypothetical protein [Bacteroidota bacterium]